MIRLEHRLRRLAQHQVRHHGRRFLAALLLNTTIVGAIATADDSVHHLTDPTEMSRVPAVRAVGIRMVPGSVAVSSLPKVEAPRLPPPLPSFPSLPTSQSDMRSSISASTPTAAASATAPTGSKVSLSESTMSSSDGVSIRLIASDAKPTKAVLPAMVIAQRESPSGSSSPAKPVVAEVVLPTAIPNELAPPAQRYGTLALPSASAMVDEAASVAANQSIPTGSSETPSRQPEWIRPKTVRAFSASSVVRLDESSIARNASEPSTAVAQDSRLPQGPALSGPAVVAAVAPTLKGPVPSVMVDVAPQARVAERPTTPSATPANSVLSQVAGSSVNRTPDLIDLKDKKSVGQITEASMVSLSTGNEPPAPHAIRIGGETISKIVSSPSTAVTRAAEPIAPSASVPSVVASHADLKNTDKDASAKAPVPTASLSLPSVTTTPSSLAIVPPTPSSLLANKPAIGITTQDATTTVSTTAVAIAPAAANQTTAPSAAIPRVSSMPNALTTASQSAPSLVTTSSNRSIVLPPSVTNRPVVTPTLPATLSNSSASQTGSTKTTNSMTPPVANRSTAPATNPSVNGPLFQIESQAASEILIDGNIMKIAVGDESICRALASNGRIFVVAGQLGETTIEVHTSTGGTPKLFQVQVVAPWQKANQGLSDIDQLRVAISNAVPEADIELQSQADGSLMVRGTVVSEEQAKRVLELTRKLMLVPVLDRVEVR